jgi:hypothetical protein
MSNLFIFPPQKTGRLNVPDDEPIYRVTGKGFFDGGTLHPEYDDQGKPTLIAYDGEPNFSLLPMNEKALVETEKWLDSLKAGVEETKKSKEYGEPGSARAGIMVQDIEVRSYVGRIKDSGRFNPERVQPAVMSNKVNKATARVIEQVEVQTPEIKSVRNKKADQTVMVNERG